ncbi:uncharacterized protein LOC128230555 isoform X2 [Mya arenaria]|uniref:uncharacterized protein LOC128230555 isoform X2 n=1 Tax=Mya arenaria TaxID=6604 RepID=UPI0022E8DF7D|nr:uncharacterized protein LOC128230555 isoform X2 [Mya arenaria]
MPIQAPQWTEFLSCPVCYNVFNEQHYRPISLACGHTVCRTCLSKFQQKKCPFDQSLISRDLDELPSNFALLQLVCATASPDNKQPCVPQQVEKFYDRAKKCVEDLALLLKPVSSSTTGSIISVSSSGQNGQQSGSNCVLSRPMQRKLITLVNCQLVEEEGRARALRAARSLGERTVTELILQHQNPQQLSSNLWAAVRGRGCQFLGPGMQEEVIKLILLALEDGSALSRKVLVLFVVQRLEAQYPQASKTAIGHVVQLLYRASCFKVTKRDEESSLMQLKEDYRTYEMLRREHDSQIVQIAMEAGLRIAPDQWSSLLYGDATHKSHMQSIIDKLQTPQTFSDSVSELLIALQRTSDPHNLSRLRPELEFLSKIDPSPDVPCPTWENLDGVMKSVKTVVEGLVMFLSTVGQRRHEFLTPFNARYKTSMCRDFIERGHCPRGTSCTFAHSDEELEKYRQKSKKAFRQGFTGLYEDEDDSQPMVPAGRGSSSYSLLKRQPSSGHQAPRGVVEQPHPGGDAPPGLGSGVPPTPGSYPTRKMEVILPPGAVMQPNGSLVPAAPNAPAGFVAPIDNTVAPAVGMENVQRVGFLPPNGDSAILQSGGIITGVESQEGILFQQQGIQPGQVAPPFQQPVPLIGATGMVQGQQPPGMVQPNSANMAGAGQQMVGPGFGQANPMAGNIGQPGMPQQGIPLGPQQQGMPGPIQQMSGMMPPYMSPYGPGGNMMGPRFPMHPMMYGQYPYPAMHPYMHYYPQGYMAPDGSRMPFDPNYFQSLNPFAEPWKPNAQGQMPSHMMNQPPYIPQGQGHGADVNGCEVCSQKMKEEEKKKQENRGHSHLCNQHYKNNSSPTLSPENQNVNYANLKGKELDTESKSDFDKSSLKEQRQILKQSFNRNNSSENWQKESQNSVKDTEETPAWSTFDDEDNDNDADYDYETSTRQFEQDRPQFESRGQNQDEYSWQAETSNSASETGKQNMSDDQSRTHPPPMLAEPNAKLYRQSLHSLHEKRNSLIQQLQEINKETIEQEQKLEELNNMPNLFKFDTDLVSEAEAVKSTLQHPAPLDTGPAKLKSNKPTNGEIFERLGAISGVLPRSVNDSILASWTTSALHDKDDDNASSKKLTHLEKNQEKSGWNEVDKEYPYWEDLTRSLESPQITPPATPYSQASSIPVSIMSTVRSLTSGSTISSHSSHFSSPFSQTITRVSSNNGTMSGIMTGTSKSSSMYSSAYSGGQSLSSMPSMSLVSTSTSQSRACGIVTTGKSRISTQMASSSPSYYTSTDYSDSSPVYNVTNKAYKKTKNIVYNSLSSPASSYENASTSNDSGFPESYSQPQSESIWPSSSYSATQTHTETSVDAGRKSKDSYYSYPSKMEEDTIPFVEGSPIISKFGPISRATRSAGGLGSGRALEVVADESAKMIPVTAVTPISSAPVPTSQMVPSRFASSWLDQERREPDNTQTENKTQPSWEKVYSYWTSEVNLLEQKAMKASTEDEKLSVKLHAIQLQITLKEQELEQARSLESQAQTSESHNPTVDSSSTTKTDWN